MQLVEIALFAAVAALALTLIGYAVRPYLRARRRLSAHKAITDAPRRRSSRRRARSHGLPRLPPRLRSRPSVLPPRRARSGPGQRSGRRGPDRSAPPAHPASAPMTRGRGTVAFDGEGLSSAAAGDERGRSGGRRGRRFAGGQGNLPNCSRRYESEATFCGRDGEELVPVGTDSGTVKVAVSRVEEGGISLRAPKKGFRRALGLVVSRPAAFSAERQPASAYRAVGRRLLARL